MVAAVCSLKERPWGVYDVRDRLVEMMKAIIPDLQETPPCLTHQAIAFVNKPEEVSKNSPMRDLYLKIQPKWSLVDVFRNLYIRLYPEILFFYGACETTEEMNKLTARARENEADLLSNLKEFLETPWWHPLKRTSILGQMKRHIIEILGSLSERSSLERQLEKTRSQIEEYRAHNALFNELLEKVNFDGYTKPDAVDSESLIRIIEHVRSETETYSSFVSTLISTLIGAIIGSALTIVVSYILGIL